MIKKCSSLLQAEKVLELIMNDPRSQELEAIVESYQNGREQGFLVWDIKSKENKTFYICEARRSDQIVIYHGSYSMQSISEDAYHNGKYFDHDDYEVVVDYVLNTLMASQIFEKLIT